MQYRSTRGASPSVGFGAALTQGLAPDGGLYVPERWPSMRPEDFAGASELSDVADVLLRPYVEGDVLAR